MRNLGSSPRVRGKQRASARVLCSRGLIPACAGKTKTHLILPKQLQAHPRVCGENLSRLCQPLPGRGSSPRVRGKLNVYTLNPTVEGLIPACAGKTRPAVRESRTRRAHPRVCGENVSAALMCLSSVGSSPRVRGKQGTGREKLHQRGLIPACAGKTSRASSTASNRWAHPRVCGENVCPSSCDRST